MLTAQQGCSHGSQSKRTGQENGNKSTFQKQPSTVRKKLVKWRLSGLKLCHTGPSCNVKPKSQCTWRAGARELWSSPTGGGARWQHPEVVRRGERWRCDGSVQRNRGIFPTSGSHLRGRSLLMAPEHNSWQFLSDNVTSDPSHAGWLVPSRVWISGKDLCCFYMPFFPKGLEAVSGTGPEQLYIKELHGWEAESHHLLAAATFPPSPEWRQPKTPSRGINVLVYFARLYVSLQGMRKIYDSNWVLLTWYEE